jgi:hypothetical protein
MKEHRKMNADGLREELLVLVGFLLTSACGLVDEPKSYGPVRLFDAAGRLLGIMEAHGILDESLSEIKEQIDRERLGSWDEETRLGNIDSLAVKWAELMVRPVGE